MATTISRNLHSLSKPFPLRFLEKYFYFSMSLVIAALVVYGFSRTIGTRLLHPQVPRPLLLYFHAACFSLWPLFFIFQSALVRTRNVRLHKLTGWFGAALAAVMIPLGCTVGVLMARFDLHALHEPQHAGYVLIVSLHDMLAFTATVVPGILLRRKPELHRRFIYIATCTLTGAAFGRFPTDFFPPLYFYWGVDALILLGALRDLAVTRRIHKIYLGALPLLFATQWAVWTVADNHWPPWERFARAIVG